VGPIVGVEYERRGVVLASDGSSLEAEGVLNPGVTRDRHGNLLMYPRMVASGNVSRIGLARGIESDDVVTFERMGVVLEPDQSFEQRSAYGGHGCEDPRITFVPSLDAYIMAYTAFGPHGPRIALAISVDAYSWSRLGPVVFADDALNHVPNKDAAFFPEPVLSPAGIPSFAFYHRPMLKESLNGQAPINLILSLHPGQREVVCIAYVPVDAARRDPAALCNVTESARVLEVGESWGRLKNGCGTPPVRTAGGWFSVFHGVDAVADVDGASLVYRAGIVLHDIDRPDCVLYRSPQPFLGPATPEERFGIVDDVVFPTGIDVRSDDRYDIYYGAADARIALARLRVTLVQGMVA
jgi:predicted GH43/DUF377 family glycosyl hydrolase